MLDSELGIPKVDEDGKRFADQLLKSVQELARQVEVMGQRFTAVEVR